MSEQRFGPDGEQGRELSRLFPGDSPTEQEPEPVAGDEGTYWCSDCKRETACVHGGKGWTCTKCRGVNISLSQQVGKCEICSDWEEVETNTGMSGDGECTNEASDNYGRLMPGGSIQSRCHSDNPERKQWEDDPDYIAPGSLVPEPVEGCANPDCDFTYKGQLDICPECGEKI